jgi:hypothetical protein
VAVTAVTGSALATVRTAGAHGTAHEHDGHEHDGDQHRRYEEGGPGHAGDPAHTHAG